MQNFYFKFQKHVECENDIELEETIRESNKKNFGLCLIILINHCKHTQCKLFILKFSVFKGHMESLGQKKF